MRNITKALGIFGMLAIVSTTSYFFVLYEHFTKLILAYGVAGGIIYSGFLYIYEWMKNKDEKEKENVEVTDRLKMYIKEVEDKIK